MKRLVAVLFIISIILSLMGCKKNWTPCSYNGLSWGMSEAEAISSLRKKDEFRNLRKSKEDDEWIVMTPKKKITGNETKEFALHFFHGKLNQFYWMRIFTYNSPQWEIVVNKTFDTMELLGATLMDSRDLVDGTIINEYKTVHETILIMVAKDQEGPVLIIKYIKI